MFLIIITLIGGTVCLSVFVALCSAAGVKLESHNPFSTGRAVTSAATQIARRLEEQS